MAEQDDIRPPSNEFDGQALGRPAVKSDLEAAKIKDRNRTKRSFWLYRSK